MALRDIQFWVQQQVSRPNFQKAVVFSIALVLLVFMSPSCALWLWSNVVVKPVKTLLSFVKNVETLLTLLTLSNFSPLTWVCYLVNFIIANLSNIFVCAELFLFEFPFKIWDEQGFIFAANHYFALPHLQRRFIGASQLFRWGVRAMALDQGRSVMPFKLYCIISFIKLFFFLDIDLAIERLVPENLQAFLLVLLDFVERFDLVKALVEAALVVDWGFLVWDSVLGPTVNLQGVLPCIIIVVLAVLGRARAQGGYPEALDRHIQWMHYVASFSLCSVAQPLVAVASFVVLIIYVKKFPWVLGLA